MNDKTHDLAENLPDSAQQQDESDDDMCTWPVISVYSRAQAIEDGVLVDVSEMAREAGIKYPTALTSAVWAEYVRVPDGVHDQDEKGRLWDVIPSTRLCRADGMGKPRGQTCCANETRQIYRLFKKVRRRSVGW